MSTISIIATIIILLAGLVCYAIVFQTSQQNKENRERLTAALNSRARNFKYILEALPEGFLPNELLLLVYKSLQDIYSQLCELSPNTPGYQEELQRITEELTDRQTNPAQNVQAVMSNPAQYKDVKACLEELHKFVFRLEERKKISPAQGQGYRLLIRQLVIKFTVDSYLIHGRKAENAEKHRLALHYYDLAMKLMMKDDARAHFGQRIVELRQQMTAVEELMKKKGEATVVAQDGENPLQSEWDSFTEEQSDWKKKQIYD